MLVFWDEKLVLLAVPKTGTTALRAAVEPDAALIFREPQARFVLEKGGPGVTHLFAYEEPERLRAFLLGRLGRMRVPDRLNVSPSMEVSLWPELAERVRRERPQEYEAWDRARRGWA